MLEIALYFILKTAVMLVDIEYIIGQKVVSDQNIRPSILVKVGNIDSVPVALIGYPG
jgi:hypothetical protein